ncbi:hypothetical protein BB560_004655, partial [Smittium megazygosporum]
MRFSILFLAAALALTSAEVAKSELHVRGNKSNEVSYDSNGYPQPQGKDQQYQTKKGKGSYRSQRLARGYEQIAPVSSGSYGDQSNQGNAYSVNNANNSGYGNNQNRDDSSNSYGTDDNTDNSGDDYNTDDNTDNSGDDYNADDNTDNSGDDYNSDGNTDNSGDDYNTDYNTDNSGDDYSTDDNTDNSGDDYSTDYNTDSVISGNYQKGNNGKSGCQSGGENSGSSGYSKNVYSKIQFSFKGSLWSSSGTCSSKFLSGLKYKPQNTYGNLFQLCYQYSQTFKNNWDNDT